MGETTAETVREIDETRRRLDTEFRELERYLPAGAVWAKRIVGVLVGGGIGGGVLWFAIRRRRRKTNGRRLHDIERRLRLVEAQL